MCSRPPSSSTIVGSAVETIVWSSDASSITTTSAPMTTPRRRPSSGGWAVTGLRLWAGLGGRVEAGELRQERGERLGLRAGHDVLRHRPGREAAVADRVQRAVLGDLADIEVRTVLVLAGAHVGRRALRAGHRERMAAAAALREQLRGGHVLFRDVDPERAARR